MKLNVKRIPNIRKVDLSTVDAEVNEFLDYVMNLIKDEPFEVQVSIRSEAAAIATEWNLKLNNR